MKKNTVAAPASAFDAGTLDKIKKWLEITAYLKQGKVIEMQLRTELAKHFFQEPKEGTNNLEFPGVEIALTQPINRSIDEPALEAVMMELPEEFRNVGVLVKYTPEVVMSGFRLLELSPEKLKVFQQALKEKPGSPQLEINIDFPTVVANLGEDFTEWPAMAKGEAPAAEEPAAPATMDESGKITPAKKKTSPAKKTATSKSKKKK